ncbi:hypothetical protein [Curtobacterium sp. MCSS17_016]|uniref:hypothetical protein n=2 Tax=unclassified Curtobacterium TaxID=257496 RepID=UPI000DA97453|nr:hypothetical protein [Curtobacterium sp. MCSS17_016]PZF14118.1 hypothetical protein DEI98_00150 [Curtobacterium sp. MCLR17_034]WIE78682.1 hypothetical protein DEJ19_016555 [Curtobacterium sp. MCSS17_016]
MTGYRLQLPEGWIRTRLSGDLDHVVDQMVERTIPRGRFGDSDGAIARRRLRDDLRQSFGAAADAGAVDMYSFEGEVSGVRLPMSFSVSVAHFGATVGALPLEVFAEALSDSGDARVVDFPAGKMIRARKEVSETAGAALRAAGPPATGIGLLSAPSQRSLEALNRFVADNADVEVSTTTVDYLAPIPGEQGTFVLVSLTAPGPTDVEARVGHFDVLMAGFGWTR